MGGYHPKDGNSSLVLWGSNVSPSSIHGSWLLSLVQNMSQQSQDGLQQTDFSKFGVLCSKTRGSCDAPVLVVIRDL